MESLPDQVIEPLAQRYHFEDQDFDEEARNEIETFLKKQKNNNDSGSPSHLEKVNGIDWTINSRLKRRGLHGKITEDDIWTAYYIWKHPPKWKKSTTSDFFESLEKLKDKMDANVKKIYFRRLDDVFGNVDDKHRTSKAEVDYYQWYVSTGRSDTDRVDRARSY